MSSGELITASTSKRQRDEEEGDDGPDSQVPAKLSKTSHSSAPIRRRTKGPKDGEVSVSISSHCCIPLTDL